MRSVLAVHDAYASASPSGENLSFAAEVELLRQRGHRVVTYVRSNDEIEGMTPAERMLLPARTIWNRRTVREVRALIREHRPDVAHIQNTFPLISPSVVAACRSEGVPVVQALRNYRLVCPAATLYRSGRVCEDCLGRALPWPGVLHGCYRDSRGASAVVAGLVTVHRVLGTWRRGVRVFVTPSAFARAKLTQGGLPSERIVVKPNFLVEDPGERSAPGRGAVAVGRLSAEKGFLTLLDAWPRTGGVPLRIVGDGPLLGMVRERAARLPGVTVLGALDRSAVLAALKDSAFLVFPSEWYETFGRVAMEAFACGVPVLASRLGAMAEAVEDGRTGLLFTPGDATDLASKVAWASAHPERMVEMGRAARADFLQRYTAEANYRQLLDLYERACASS